MLRLARPVVHTPDQWHHPTSKPHKSPRHNLQMSDRYELVLVPCLRKPPILDTCIRIPSNCNLSLCPTPSIKYLALCAMPLPLPSGPSVRSPGTGRAGAENGPRLCEASLPGDGCGGEVKFRGESCMAMCMRRCNWVKVNGTIPPFHLALVIPFTQILEIVPSTFTVQEQIKPASTPTQILQTAPTDKHGTCIGVPKN